MIINSEKAMRGATADALGPACHKCLRTPMIFGTTLIQSIGTSIGGGQEQGCRKIIFYVQKYCNPKPSTFYQRQFI